MYRTKKGQWVVYSGPVSFTTADRFEIEQRLAKHGLRPEEIERLFLSEAEKGEGVVSVPILRLPRLSGLTSGSLSASVTRFTNSPRYILPE
jgi:hypothetical protein